MREGGRERVSESEGGGCRANNGKKGDDRDEEGVRVRRWNVFREGCVNDQNWLEGEEVAVEVRKNNATINRGGIKMSREAAGMTRGDEEERAELRQAVLLN